MQKIDIENVHFAIIFLPCKALLTFSNWSGCQ